MTTKPRGDPAEQRRYLRFFYQGWRPTRLGRIVNRMWTWWCATGLPPHIMLTLETRGRRSGRRRANVLVNLKYKGVQYLVSMLGNKAEWVQNVRAARGRAAIRRLWARPVQLTEIPVEERAPILKEYCVVARSGRNHFPIPPTAPVEAFAAIAGDYPVFRIDTA